MGFDLHGRRAKPYILESIHHNYMNCKNKFKKKELQKQAQTGNNKDTHTSFVSKNMPPKITKKEDDGLEIIQEGEEPRRLADYVKIMMTGVEVTRHRVNRKPKQYELKLSEDFAKVTWINIKKVGQQNPIMRNILFLVDIVNVGKGQTSDAFKKYPDKERRQTSFTIDYAQVDGEKMQLDIVFNELEHFQAWFYSLKYLVGKAVRQFEVSPLSISLQKLWVKGDVKGVGKLSKGYVKDLVENGMNIGLKSDVFEEKFATADGDGDGSLGEKELEKLVWDIKRNSVVDDLWSKYTKGRNMLTVEQLEAFQNKEQKVFPATADVANEVEELTGKKSGFTKNQFFTYLTQSTLNDAVHNDAEKAGYQNMGFPLTEYFINASINSNDVPKTVSWNTITHVQNLLRQGVRFLHIPVSMEEEVISVGTDKSDVKSRAPLADYLNAIKATSFCQPHLCFPVLILFENYLTGDKQKVAIQMIKDILGFAIETEKTRNSPHELQGRYLLGVFNSSSCKATLDGGWEEIMYLSYKPYVPCYDRARDHSTSKLVIMGMGMQALERAVIERSKVETTVAVHSQYLALLMSRSNERSTNVALCWAAGVHLAGVNFHIIDEENKYMGIILTGGKFSHNGNCGYVLKPTTLRNPAAKSKTPKKVAVKKATADDLMAATQGEKGNTRKKIEPEDPLDPSFGSTPDDRCACKLIIRVISAQQIPRPDGDTGGGDIPDPYVEVRCDAANGPECYAEGKDPEAPFTVAIKTQVQQDNGFCPMWDEEIPLNVKSKETAIVTFRIFDKEIRQDEFLCQRSVPAAILLTGYRCLFLRDGMGLRIPSAPSIFIHIKESRIGSIDQLQQIKIKMENELAELDAEIHDLERKMQHNKKKLKAINDNTKTDQKKLEEVKKQVEPIEKGWFTLNWAWFGRTCFFLCGMSTPTYEESERIREEQAEKEREEKEALARHMAEMEKIKKDKEKARKERQANKK
eukprot:PhF_6_TR10070/c0_g1_i1/m.15621/K05857/PLCD; phosphatidylinositol phospholipase C, delta